MPNLCFLNLHAEVNYGYSNSQKGSRMVVGGCIPPYFPGFNLFHLCIFWRCTSTYFYICLFKGKCLTISAPETMPDIYVGLNTPQLFVRWLNHAKLRQRGLSQRRGRCAPQLGSDRPLLFFVGSTGGHP